MSLAGIENRDATIENRISILDSILDSRKDRGWSVNLLLNGTVVILVIIYSLIFVLAIRLCHPWSSQPSWSNIRPSSLGISLVFI